ncbi:MAG TPA: cytidylate kinase-like family protein [Vicinamibacterales bacterium]|jgi:cytidylate kinase
MSKSYGQLIPSVERRLSTWVSLSEKYAGSVPLGSRPTVTISRRFGCEGYPLSEQIKTLLEARTGETWIIYDKALLELVSQDENLSVQLLRDLGGPSRSLDTIGFLVPGYRPQDEVFRHIPKHIVRIAEAGNAIIVGQGGAIITQQLENCYHFRLDASFEFRVASMSRRLEISEDEARKLVRKNQEARDRFLEDCLHVSVSDVSLYDAVFNNARHTVTEIAQSIAAYVLEGWRSAAHLRQTIPF